MDDLPQCLFQLQGTAEVQSFCHTAEKGNPADLRVILCRKTQTCRLEVQGNRLAGANEVELGNRYVDMRQDKMTGKNTIEKIKVLLIAVSLRIGGEEKDVFL